MATTVRELIARFKGDTRSLEAATKRANIAVSSVQTRVKAAGASVAASFGAMAKSFAPLLGAFAAFRAVGIADQFTELEVKIRNVTDTQEEYNRVFRGLTQIAQENGAELASLADAYLKLNLSTSDAVKENTDLLKITDLLARGFAAAGTNAQTASGATLQLTQGLATNFKAAGQELNSIIEGAPLLARVIAEQLGGSAAVDLKRFAQEGRLTTETFLAALEASESAIKAFDIPPTFGREVQRFKNELLLFIGASDDASNSTNMLGSVVSFATNRLEEMRHTVMLINPAFKLIALQVKESFNDVLVTIQNTVIKTQVAIENLSRGAIKFKELGLGVYDVTFQRNIEDTRAEIREIIDDMNNGIETTSSYVDANEKLKTALSNVALKTDEASKKTKEARMQIKKAKDAIQELRNEAIDNLVDGLAEGGNAFNNFRNVAINALRDVAANLLKLSLGGQSSGGLGGTLASALFSGLTSGSMIGSTAKFSSRSFGQIALAAAGGAQGPGFATGGSMTVGGTGGTDSQLIQFKATPNERITVEKPGQNLRGNGGGEMVTVNQTINVTTGVQQTVRAELNRYLPVIQGSTTKAVEDARRRGKV